MAGRSKGDIITLPLVIPSGGTGAITAPAARTSLGIRAASLASSLGGVAGFPGFTRAYRIPLTGGSGGSAGFQLRILIGESSGSSGVDFHVGGNSQSFPSGENVGGDFKFTKADGSVVEFFVERITGTTPNRVAIIWVALPGGTSADTIFLLTDNNIITVSQSNSAGVFPAFFDSFAGSAVDTSKWTILNSTGITVSSGSMRHTNSNGLLRSNASFSTPGIILEILWTGVTRSPGGHHVGGFGSASALTTDSIGYLWHVTSDFIRNNTAWPNQGATLAANIEILTRFTLTRVSIFDFVVIRHENYLTGAVLRTGTQINTVSGEHITIGRRFDGINQNQSIDMSWREVKVRQAGTAPSVGTVTEV